MGSARRFIGAVTSRCANLRFVFAVGAMAVVAGKVVHVYAHLPALATSDLLHWGLSFFAQDVVLLLVLRLLFDLDLRRRALWLRIIAPATGSAVVAVLLALASFNVSFFYVTGAEIHWRNIGFASDSNSRKLLLEGLLSCSLTFGAIVLVGWLLQDGCHRVMGLVLEITQWPFVFLWRKLPIARSRVKYAHLPQLDTEEAAVQMEPVLDGKGDDADKADDYPGDNDAKPISKLKVLSYAVVGIILFVIFVEIAARPKSGGLTFMSWTLPLLPFVDFYKSAPSLGSLAPVYGSSIEFSWDNRTALHKPVRFNWLPRGKPLAGFEDWYKKGRTHYRADQDPMRISNLKNDLLPQLRKKLASVKIRHVMLIKLESTRKDIFPLKHDGLIWDKLAKSFPDNRVPPSVGKFLSTLTPTANFLTGEYDDGFQHANKTPRGGINFKSAHTTATYTLKSLAGTICGLSPVTVDFNVEVFNHIYQPCLPHIFDAFNALNHSRDKATHDFTSFKWKSSFMQSVTNLYDRQDMLMTNIGFPPENTVAYEYLKGPSPKFGPPRVPETHWWSIPEVALEDYVRDAFASAKKNNERVFLTHLTGTTHMPFWLPKYEKYVPLTKDDNLRQLSKYVNTVGSVDRWLKRVLDILDEEGVADETLVVFVGDHGISIAEEGSVTPYYNPHVANFHVPLVLSHPKLPQINVNDSVISLQILPTILDMLRETGSLSKSESRAAGDLMRNYEGQSLLRPINKVSNETGQPNWQFTVLNPGRAMVSVRDASRPEWRIVVPIVDDVEWRFVNLDEDPHERSPVRSLTFRAFLGEIEEKHGIAAAEWAEAAAFMGRWWVEENWKRWRALQAALAGGKTDIVDYLLSQGEDPNYDYLLVAAKAGFEKAVVLLLDYGAEADNPDENFKIPQLEIDTRSA
ncbi:sulfatase [Thelonectria olida]|uniref:Sulfatase n=1 Tax=Thelonectria olida TaxID=1576542 RepID=A0A9P8VMX6_9HYPO|nr:sulfatase [Thelonectria olida]